MSVPSQFPRTNSCKIAFVGEAPGADEVRHGRPFVGSSGQLLDKLLRTAGLSREDYYIGNVFNEKLPDNDVKNWCIPLKTARELGLTDLPSIGSAGFLRPDYRHHLHRLQGELEQCRPNVVVPLGGTALWALTGSSGITAMRGQVIPATRLIPGLKLLPTFHPNAVQMQWKLYPVVVGDFIKANAEAMRGPEIVLPKRELILEPTVDDIKSFVERAKQSDLLSVDIETGWGTITSIGFAVDDKYALVIPLFDRRKANRSFWAHTETECEVWRLIREIMNLPAPKLGQNFGMYDAYWLMEKYHIFPRNFLHDTRLLHHALYPELPKSLEFLSGSYSSQGPWKRMVKRGDKRRDEFE